MPGVTIAVPARNEARHLAGLFHALARQRGAPPFTLLLFFDGCGDGGAALAAELAGAMPFGLAIAAAAQAGPPNAGLARARACAEALALSPDAVLLTTDADSAPAPDWIAASLAGLAAADIVAGRIEPHLGARSPLQQRLAAYLDRLHRHRRIVDPVPWEDARSHHWTSAASLAFRPGLYPMLGGFAPLPQGEDAELGDRAWRLGLRLRRDARVRVSTSARRGGRTAGGFAGLLAALDRDSIAPPVAHPDDESWRYHHHAWARRCWAGGISDGFAEGVGIDRYELDRLATAAANAEAFTACAVGTPPCGMRSLPLACAEAALDALDAGALAGAA